MPLEAEAVLNILTKNITLRSGSPPLPSLPVFLHNFSRKSSGLLQSWILQAVTVLLSSSSKLAGCLLYERLSIAKDFANLNGSLLVKKLNDSQSKKIT